MLEARAKNEADIDLDIRNDQVMICTTLQSLIGLLSLSFLVPLLFVLCRLCNFC